MSSGRTASLEARIEAVVCSVLDGNLRGARSVAATLPPTSAYSGMTEAEEQLRAAVMDGDGDVAGAWAHVVKRTFGQSSSSNEHPAVHHSEGAAASATTTAAVSSSSSSYPPPPAFPEGIVMGSVYTAAAVPPSNGAPAAAAASMEEESSRACVGSDEYTATVLLQPPGGAVQVGVQILSTVPFAQFAAAVRNALQGHHGAGSDVEMSFAPNEASPNHRIELEDDDDLATFWSAAASSRARAAPIVHCTSRSMPLPAGLRETVAYDDGAASAPPFVIHSSATCALHRSSVRSVACSATKAVSCSGDGTVCIWEPEDPCTAVQVMKSSYTGSINRCAISPDGRTVVAGADDNKIRVWEARTGNKLHTLHHHDGGVFGVDFSSDGSLFVSASRDRTLRVWRTRDAYCQTKIDRKLPVALFCCAMSNGDGGRHVVAGGDGQTENLFVWDWKTQGVRTLAGHTKAVWSCCFSPSDACILSGSQDATVRLWNTASGVVLREFVGHGVPVHHAIFLHEKELILSCGRDNVARVWEMATGRHVGTFEGHTGFVVGMSLFSSNRLITCSIDRTCRVWQLPPALCFNSTHAP